MSQSYNRYEKARVHGAGGLQVAYWAADVDDADGTGPIVVGAEESDAGEGAYAVRRSEGSGA
jgi:DNA-directed RNA polymerase subunit K/omega